MFVFDHSSSSFLRSRGEAQPEIPEAAARYARHTLTQPLSAALQVSLQTRVYHQLKHFLIWLVQSSFEQSYNTLDSGFDILSAYDPNYTKGNQS